ncbi:glycoside hydrolase family 3 protein [Streptomyces sp. NBC_01808]|uniref:glycoside hydrolase family 3 protein n=1 Tax=Streptomyces sp. NBC_01808 TaxID=2975947 RepID=UPI002DD8191A|nr:glycoside hydrolase family 3 protein [Streptomyces sp. NBC_01808]WSA37234.1 glycoside hydrolase family 3 protein [Streptomyces sp. NBC_01808]
MRSTTTRRQAVTGLLGTAAALGAGTAAAGPAAARSGGTAGSGSYARLLAGALARRMTLEEKVGQLFVVEVAGQDADDVTDAAAAVNERRYGVRTPADVVRKYRPGAVIYFSARNDDNLRDARQIARLSNGLQRASLAQRRGVPLIISTDQESGLVQRLPTPPATELPGSMAVGATYATADAQRAAEITGRELAALGINQNYAPVADVNVNPDNPVIGLRSYGADPQQVARMVAAAVRGQRRGGVASAAKHFPGHGDTGQDSHFLLPRIEHTLGQIHELDLPPFRAAIAAGLDTVMTAHILVPALDDGVPATMSHRILTGLLREELGFDGLIVTDALDMGGATSQYPPERASVAAFAAGADMLVLPPQMDVAYESVLAAVRGGEIGARRLDESVVRILARKIDEGLYSGPFVDERRAERIVGNAAHVADARALTGRAVTLVKNDTGLLPLAAEPRRVLVAGWQTSSAPALDRLAQGVGARGGQTATVLATGGTPGQAVIDAAVAAARDHDLVLVSANAAAGAEPVAQRGAAQAALVRALLASGTPVAVVAVRNPYDVRRFPEAPVYLCTYGTGAGVLARAADALYGDLRPTGRLPVAIPELGATGADLYPLGHGLEY